MAAKAVAFAEHSGLSSRHMHTKSWAMSALADLGFVREGLG